MSWPTRDKMDKTRQASRGATGEHRCASGERNVPVEPSRLRGQLLQLFLATFYEK